MVVTTAGLYKMFPVTVRIFDINFGRIMTKFLKMNMLLGPNALTAQFEFNNIDRLFERYGLDWELVTGLGLEILVYTTLLNKRPC